MGFHLVRSSDGGSPTLSGTVGGLITVLDYCLVTIAGWTKAYSGTNKAAYQYTGSHPLLRVQDDSAILNAKEARLRAYESMTDVDTGVNPYPTVTQLTNGLYVLKSITADTTTRQWEFITKDGTFYFTVHVGNPAGTGTAVRTYTFGFGEFISYKPGDTHNFFILGYTTIGSDYLQNGTNSTNTEGKYIKRDIDGITTSVAHYYQINGYSASNNIGNPSVYSIAYPNPADGGLYITPIEFYSASSGLRGRVPGLWTSRNVMTSVASENDTFSATINGQARTFEFFNSWQDYNRATLIIETSDTWLL